MEATLQGTLKDFLLSGDVVFFPELRTMCTRRLWKRAPLSMVATLGDLEEGPFTGEFERQ
jgi:hypothetical protein